MLMMVVVMSLMLSLNIFHTFFYSPAHNILKLYNVLAQVRCATSTTKFVIQYNQLVLRVDSRVAKQLNTQDLNKLGNIRKISNLDEDLSQSLVSPQEIKFWQWQLKIAKVYPKHFQPCPILLDFSILLQIFGRNCTMNKEKELGELQR